MGGEGGAFIAFPFTFELPASFSDDDGNGAVSLGVDESSCLLVLKV